MAVVAVLVIGLTPVQPAWAVNPDEVLADAALEARARALSAELRCVVCQNQSIDDSDAPLAKDLRRLVRERLTAGDTDNEVKAYLVDRYGTFVLLKPPLNNRTLLLWLLPFVIGAGAIIVVYRGLFRARPERSRTVETQTDLSDDEQSRLDAVLNVPPGSGSGES